MRRTERRQSIAGRLRGPVEELLAEGRSFADLTVDEILERSDVPRSTLYYNFGEKSELLIAISEDAIREIVEASHGLYGLGPDRTKAQLTERVRETLDVWVRHVPLMNALAEGATTNPRVRDHFLAAWSAARTGVAEHIREGQEDGTVRADVHPTYTGAWLTWMAERGVTQLAATADPSELDAICAALADIVWSVLYGD